MFKIAVVVFRECLEIALLLGVIMAVTKPLTNSRIYIIMGSLIGIVLAALFAIFARTIKASFDGFGDEIWDSGIILLTSLIISWTVVWMQGYARKIRKNLEQLSENIKAGTASKFMLVVVVATAILREAAEMILFVYSVVSVGSSSNTEYIIGLALGITTGLIVGIILYFGLIKYASKYIFTISTILLTLIAAGLAAEAAGILTSAGIIELYSQQMWDSSWLINSETIIGKILKITIGYDATPNGMQIIFYLSNIMITTIMIKVKSITSSSSHKQQTI